MANEEVGRKFSRLRRWTRSRDTGERFTYRFRRRGENGERHFDTRDAALTQAVADFEHDRALPLHIRQGNLLVMNQEEIFDEWEKRFLS